MSETREPEQKICSENKEVNDGKTIFLDDFEELLEQVKKDYSEYNFRGSRKFAFRPPSTILVGPRERRSDLLLLHELGHAELKHRDFGLDITRIKMENEAWEKARELAAKYGVEFDDELVQGELDSYRDWLHRKSRCPACGLTRFQTPSGEYHCPRCEM